MNARNGRYATIKRRLNRLEQETAALPEEAAVFPSSTQRPGGHVLPSGYAWEDYAPEWQTGDYLKADNAVAKDVEA